eukprot:CAMPEP_0116849288 /NCGR_PEP_ID=MMETSP0418-20121206/15489_1 /TAXON_ID=1158023 /ORGANISM="Astrosyne radiata, Strain 13vi08-1A" /LENGTH=122 /DNA_ID=CAMNT_0004480993 /DNA_START=119 /DNA_END=487 /DNA_ORIENTATION=-
MDPPPGERYYKLNQNNIATGRIPTLEFRQHSATTSPEKVLNWVRFCVNFCSNSIRLRAPLALKEGRSVEQELDFLFQFVIEDRYLASFYRARKSELPSRKRPVDVIACCGGCAGGVACSGSH